MRREMRTAYALIYAYKSGAIKQGTEITPEQDRLIRTGVDSAGPVASLRSPAMIEDNDATMMEKRVPTS